MRYNMKYYNVIFRKYFQRKIRKREIKCTQRNQLLRGIIEVGE